MPDEPILREKAREALYSRRMPTRHPDRTWSGPGVGASCPVCELPITSDQLELEVEFTRNGDTLTLDAFHVHIRCFAAWEFERTKV